VPASLTCGRVTTLVTAVSPAARLDPGKIMASRHGNLAYYQSQSINYPGY
jgi:hypothetical protein